MKFFCFCFLTRVRRVDFQRVKKKSRSFRNPAFLRLCVDKLDGLTKGIVQTFIWPVTVLFRHSGAGQNLASNTKEQIQRFESVSDGRNTDTNVQESTRTFQPTSYCQEKIINFLHYFLCVPLSTCFYEEIYIQKQRKQRKAFIPASHCWSTTLNIEARVTSPSSALFVSCVCASCFCLTVTKHKALTQV